MRPLALLALALLVPSPAPAGTITVKGSDTMVILVQRWAEEFMKKHPETKVQVTGGGSGTGIAALLNGTTEVAASSREMKAPEREKLRARPGAQVVELPVAKDGVTFYVNEHNSVAALTEPQLRAIYLGDVTRWEQVGGSDAPIVLYSRESSSGTYVFVKDTLLKGEDFAAAAQTLPGTAAVVNAVAREKNGIGYGGAAYAKGVRELAIRLDGQEIAPSAENIKSGKYPLARDLYFYLRAQPQGEVKRFIDFVLSPEGQTLVTRLGYFPIG